MSKVLLSQGCGRTLLLRFTLFLNGIPGTACPVTPSCLSPAPRPSCEGAPSAHADASAYRYGVMTQTPPDDETTLQERKLALEVKKLQVEIGVLQNPYRHPQFWGAVLVAVVSLFLAVGQYFRSNQEYVLAQIKTERLALDAERLEQKRGQLETVSTALARENEIRRAALASAEAEFRGVQERLTSTKLTRDQLNREASLLRQAIGKLKTATAPFTISLIGREGNGPPFTFGTIHMDSAPPGFSFGVELKEGTAGASPAPVVAGSARTVSLGDSVKWTPAFVINADSKGPQPAPSGSPTPSK